MNLDGFNLYGWNEWLAFSCMFIPVRSAQHPVCTHDPYLELELNTSGTNFLFHIMVFLLKLHDFYINIQQNDLNLTFICVHIWKTLPSVSYQFVGICKGLVWVYLWKHPIIFFFSRLNSNDNGFVFSSFVTKYFV